MGWNECTWACIEQATSPKWMNISYPNDTKNSPTNVCVGPWRSAMLAYLEPLFDPSNPLQVNPKQPQLLNPTHQSSPQSTPPPPAQSWAKMTQA